MDDQFRWIREATRGQVDKSNDLNVLEKDDRHVRAEDYRGFLKPTCR